MSEILEVIEHASLAEALLHAQAEYEPLDKGKTVKVDTKSGGSYSYNYADLAYTRKVTDPVLWKHGLVIRDKVAIREGKELLISTITHIQSKESEESEIEISTNGDMKALGGNITYARRYNYWNLTGRIGEDDSEPRDLGRSKQSKQRQQEPPGNSAGDKPPPATGDNVSLRQQCSQAKSTAEAGGATGAETVALMTMIFGEPSWSKCTDSGKLADFIDRVSKLGDDGTMPEK